MLFSELVLQGVRRFEQMHRFPLGAGLTVFVGDSGTGKSTVLDVLEHVLFLDPMEPATTAFQSSGGGPCRVALMIDDRGGQRYRLVNDLVQGAIALTKLDAASGRFAPISSSAAEILQYLSSTLHLPQKDLFDTFYLVRDRALASAQPREAGLGPHPGAGRREGGLQAGRGLPQTGGAGLPGGRGRPPSEPARRLPPSPSLEPQGADGPRFPGYQGGELGEEEVLPDDPKEIRSQIQALERDLVIAQETDQAQFKLDGLQSEIFELDQKTKSVQEVSSRVSQLQAQWKEFGNLSDLPGDFEKRVREFEDRKTKYQRDLAHLEDEKASWEKKAQQAAPVPLAKNRIFQIGLLLAVLSLVAGVAGFFLSQGLRYVALLDMVGFGIAAVAAIRHIDQSLAGERDQARLALIDQRRQKLDKQYDTETSIVRHSMKAVGMENPAEILDRYNQRSQVAKALEEAKEQEAARKKDIGLAELEAKKKKLQEEAQAVEAKLAGASGLTMGPREMERRLSQLKEKLERLESGGSGGSGATPGAGTAAGGPPFAAPDANVGLRGGLEFGSAPGSYLDGSSEDGTDSFAAETPVGDVCKELTKLALDLFLVDMDRLSALLSPRASQYVAALTNHAYPKLVLAPDGAVELTEAATGSSVSSVQLPLTVLDLVVLGLKFTVVEAISRQQPVPLFLDDPFKRLPQDRLPLFGKMLAGLARFTQVVLYTSQGELASYATASFQL